MQTDAILMVRELERYGFTVEWKRVDTPSEFESALEDEPWEVIFADYRVPTFGIPESLENYKSKELDIPFIVVSGRVGEEVVVETLKNGAHDYVMKDNLARLGPVLQRALREAQMHREHVQDQQQLLANERQFRALFLQSPDAIFVESLEGEVLDVNQAACQLHGVDRDELVGKHVMDLVPLEHQAAVRRDFPNLVNGTTDLVEGLSLSVDGKSVPVEIRAAHLQYQHQPALLLHVRDISARRAAEEQSDELRAQLTHLQRLNGVGEVASTLAHEVNQPLGVIANYAGRCAELVEEGAGQPEDITAALSAINEQALIAGQITQRLRAFVSRHQAKRTATNINDLVQDVRRLLHGEAARHHASLELDLQPALPDIVVDSIQIEQVLFNLVRNSIDSLGDDADQNRNITVRTSQDNGHVCVEVADHGCGIERDELESVFEPYFTSKPDGLGLGLSICRTIVKSHSGSIAAESDPARGTIFRMTLPAKKQHA